MCARLDYFMMRAYILAGLLSAPALASPSPTSSPIPTKNPVVAPVPSPTKSPVPKPTLEPTAFFDRIVTQVHIRR